MTSDSSPPLSQEELRATARAQGVDPSDADLEAVGAFLATILPALRELEDETDRTVPPAGLYLPGDG